MSEEITLDFLKEKLNFFRQMYDEVRLVDPVKKRVLERSDECAKETDPVCHAYWQNGRVCDNCISIRAYHNRKSFIKLECTPHKIMLVTALPVYSGKQPVVLELLKDTTETMLVGSGDYERGKSLHAAVRDLNRMVIVDGLTSVYNRRFLDDRLPADISAALLGRRPLSVIFIDINNMKRINDTFGHAAGDQVIQQSAGIISAGIRQGLDWVARYGGDEFFVCLNAAGAGEADRVARRIRDGFARENFLVGQKRIRISASQGVVTMPEQGCTAEQIIRLSDRRMYGEKRRSKRERR